MPMERPSWQQNHELRSPSRSGSRSSRGGGVIGGAGFTAVAAATGDTAAAAATGDTAGAPEHHTATLPIAAFTRSAKKNKRYSQDHVWAVLALQELSRSESGLGDDVRQKRRALEIGGAGGGRHPMSGEPIQRQETPLAKGADQRDGWSRSTSRPRTKNSHQSDQAMAVTARCAVVARGAPTSDAGSPAGAEGDPAKNTDAEVHTGDGVIMLSVDDPRSQGFGFMASANAPTSKSAPAFPHRAVSSDARARRGSPTSHPRGDGMATTATATATESAKEILVMRRRLSNGTALKRLYVPLNLASAFMPPLSPFRANAKRRRVGDKGGAEDEEVGGDGEESAGACGSGPAAGASAAADDDDDDAAAAADSKSNAASAARMTLTFVAVSADFGCLPRGAGSGVSGEEELMTTHEVEYERRQFGDQVHHRLTKGWHAMCLSLRASVGDTIEMSRSRNGHERNSLRVEDGGSEGIDGGGGADSDGPLGAAPASGKPFSPIYIRIVQ